MVEGALDEAAVVDRVRALWHEAAVNGRPLPGEPTLARRLDVGRQAVREALIRLEAEGLISRRRGAETAVNVRAVGIRARFDRKVDFAQLLGGGGRAPVAEVLGAAAVTLDATQAERLDRRRGSRAWRIARRWSGDRRTLVATVDLVPLPDGAPTPPTHLSLAEVVAEIHGTRAEWEMVRPDAVAADEETATMCEVDVGGPLLSLHLVGVARSGRLLYDSRELYRPGVFDFDFIRVIEPGHD